MSMHVRTSHTVGWFVLWLVGFPDERMRVSCVGSSCWFLGMLLGALDGMCVGWVGCRWSICALAVWEFELAAGYDMLLGIGYVRWDVARLAGWVAVDSKYIQYVFHMFNECNSSLLRYFIFSNI